MKSVPLRDVFCISLEAATDRLVDSPDCLARYAGVFFRSGLDAIGATGWAGAPSMEPVPVGIEVVFDGIACNRNVKFWCKYRLGMMPGVAFKRDQFDVALVFAVTE